MGLLLLIILIILVVNVGLIGLLKFAERGARLREERLTRRAAEKAIEKGVAHVRGDEWARSFRR